MPEGNTFPWTGAPFFRARRLSLFLFSPPLERSAVFLQLFLPAEWLAISMFFSFFCFLIPLLAGLSPLESFCLSLLDFLLGVCEILR